MANPLGAINEAFCISMMETLAYPKVHGARNTPDQRKDTYINFFVRCFVF
jgi:hypothetical protein